MTFQKIVGNHDHFNNKGTTVTIHTTCGLQLIEWSGRTCQHHLIITFVEKLYGRQ